MAHREIAIGQLWKVSGTRSLRVALVDGDRVEGSLYDSLANTTSWWVGRRGYFASYELVHRDGLDVSASGR